jgi:hypothetical protein
VARTDSKVGVWNKALRNIGETDRIEDPTDTARLAAEVCNEEWEDAVEEVLGKLPWAFARRHGALQFAVAQYDSTTTYALDNLVRDDHGKVYKSLQAANAGNDLDQTAWWEYQHQLGAGWGFVYTLPDDCVQVLWLLEEDENIEDTPLEERKAFEIISDSDLEDPLLACDEDISADDFQCLEYTGLHEYVKKWPRLFLMAVAWRLAKPLALALRKDPRVAISLCEEQYRAVLSEARAESLNTGVRRQELQSPSLNSR